jgi:protein FAM50
VTGFNGLLFDYSAQPTKATPVAEKEVDSEEPTVYDPLNQTRRDKNKESGIPEDELEGFNDDPAITKVVDRRWYERNKHIFPASAWAEYAPEKDLSKVQRKDTEGNTFFFS